MRELSDKGIATSIPKKRTISTDESMDDSPNVTPHRWLILIGLSGCILMDAAACATFAPIEFQVHQAYNVSLFEVEFCSLIFFANYVVFTFVAMPMYLHFDYSRVMRVACVIFVVGAWTRQFVSDESNSFYPALIG